MELKQEQMLARLDNRHRERETNLELQKQKKDWTKSQNVQNFEIRFELIRERIVELLKQCEETITSTVDNSNSTTTTTATLTQYFEEINTLMQNLQKLVAESAPTLPSYDMRKSQSKLNELNVRVLNVQNKCQPKKQFTFSSRKKGVSSTFVADNFRSPDDIDTSDGLGVAENKNGLQISEAKTFSAKLKNDISINFGGECNGSDVVLADLVGCSIKISGNPSTLYVNKLSRCTVVSLPISTSVFIENCRDVQFVIACQQLRVHSSVNCQFYLHVTSRAIIEDCRELQFAPYSLIHDDDRRRVFSAAGLDYERNNWNNVDDFNWPVKSTPSPNWKIIDESERKSFQL